MTLSQVQENDLDYLKAKFKDLFLDIKGSMWITLIKPFGWSKVKQTNIQIDPLGMPEFGRSCGAAPGAADFPEGGVVVEVVRGQEDGVNLPDDVLG